MLKSDSALEPKIVPHHLENNIIVKLTQDKNEHKHSNRILIIGIYK